MQSVAEAFITLVGKDLGYSDEVAKAGGGKIFTFGSFRLGVFGPGSDIDTLVVGPKYVTRDHFFEYFPKLLHEMSEDGAIEDLTPVMDSFVPIIKFEYKGISIDLIYSRIDTLSTIPTDLDLQDSNLLRGLDETDLRSVNGTRVTDAILDLVPQKSVFRTALRGIKLWAQRRAIYANIMGFPGGVAWAMLVARVCQLYPKATASIVILKFFKIMEAWQWPMPVLLKPMESGPLKVRVWNPRVYKGDAYHLMPIITPAYPSMCATHNITKSNMTVIKKELKRGGQIVDQILSGREQWKALFTKHTFFTQDYKYYLSVVSASTTADAQKIWSGLVESKVRFLVSELERHKSIALAHPFNKGANRKHICKNYDEIELVKAGKLDFLVTNSRGEDVGRTDAVMEDAAKKEASSNGDSVIKEDSDEPNAKEENGDAEKTEPEKNQGTMVWTTTFYIGLELAEGAKSLDLSREVDAFKERCLGWDKYDQELNALSIITTKKWVLTTSCIMHDADHQLALICQATSSTRARLSQPSHPRRRS